MERRSYWLDQRFSNSSHFQIFVFCEMWCNFPFLLKFSTFIWNTYFIFCFCLLFTSNQYFSLNYFKWILIFRIPSYLEDFILQASFFLFYFYNATIAVNQKFLHIFLIFLTNHQKSSSNHQICSKISTKLKWDKNVSWLFRHNFCYSFN